MNLTVGVSRRRMGSFSSDVGSMGVTVSNWSNILVILLVVMEVGGSSMSHEKKKSLRNNHVYLNSATPRVASITATNDRRRLDDEGTTSANNTNGDEDAEVLPPVKYIGTMGRTCQGKFNTMGEVDVNYKLVRNLTLKGCMEACSAASNGTKGSIGGTTATETATTDGQENSTSITTDDDEESYYCAGYQHTTFDEGTTECHLWYHYGPGDGVEDSNSFCFWKADLGSGQQCCIPTTEMKTDLCASEGSGGSINFPAVKCGPQQCEYDNYCLALVAGNFLKEECTEQCTEPVDEYNSCDGQPFSPVQCSKGESTSSASTSTTSRSSTTATIGSNLKCTYDNLCLAQKAGYTTLDSTCEDVCPTVGRSGTGSTNDEKRSTTRAFTCAATTDTTGTDSATSSESDTTTVNSAPICDVNTTNVVAPSTNGTTSTSNSNVVSNDGGNSTSASVGTGGGIVLCGVHQCPYDNICLGMEAGFAMEQCASI